MKDAKTSIFYVCVFLALVFVLTRTGTDGTAERSDTDRAVGNLKAGQSIVGVEISRAENASGSLGSSLEGAASAVGGSRNNAEAISARIDGVKSTLSECEDLARKLEEFFERYGN